MSYMDDNNKYKHSNESQEKKSMFDFSDNIAKLTKAKKIEPIKELVKLCDCIINFYKAKQKMLDEHCSINDEKTKFYYRINENAETLLIEALNMKSISNRNDKIKKIYYWYLGKVETFQDLKDIKERTEKDWYQIEDELPVKVPPAIPDDPKSHRCFIGGFESAGKRLEDYKVKKILKDAAKALTTGVSFKDENASLYTKEFGYQTMANFKSLNDISNVPSYINPASQQSTKYGTFYNKGKSKPEINTGSDWFSQTGLDFHKEIKESYSYIRPPYDYEFLQLEKEILAEKHKELNEKRNEEEINLGVMDFAFRKSFYKGSLNQKKEMKTMITKYRELLEIKRKEEITRKEENELKKKLENERIQKEFQEKQKIAMTKMRPIKKPKKIIIDVENTTDNIPLEKKEIEIEKEINNISKNDTEGKNENSLTNIKLEKSTENENRSGTQKRNDSKKILRHKGSLVVEPSPFKKRDSVVSIVYKANSYKIDNNNIKHIEQPENRQDVKKIDIEFKLKSTKMKEICNQKLYKKNLLLQLENDIQNEGLQKKDKISETPLTSDMAIHNIFTNRLYSLRTMNRAMVDIKYFDMAKERYLESFNPLSYYDNKNTDFNESIHKNLRKRSIVPVATMNFNMKNYYEYKDNFLQMRQTLSAHKFRDFTRTSLYRNSKNIFKFNFDKMNKVPEAQTSLPGSSYPVMEASLIKEPKK